jgi:hypothetical protein
MIKTKIAVMQPYFLPYIGYYQLIKEVDTFVIADSYQFAKQSWINRNRIINNGAINFLTLPMKKAPHQSSINNRFIAETFSAEKFLKTIHHSYHKANFYWESIPIIEEIISYKELNLNDFLMHSIDLLLNHFEINKNYIRTSELNIKHNLSPQEKIISICKDLDATTYINLPGGRNLYDASSFTSEKIELKFINTCFVSYPQIRGSKIRTGDFVPKLSIVDMIFNDGIKNIIETHLPNYKLNN